MPVQDEDRWAETKTRRYDPSFPGIVYVIVTMFLAVGAINSQNNLLFWAFGLGVAGVIVSGVISGAALMGLQVRRDVLGMQRVGEPIRVRYLVRNRNGYAPAMGLLFREKCAAARSQKGRAELLAFLDHAPSGGTRPTTRSSSLAVKRGVFALDQIAMQSGFPFGLFKKSIVFLAKMELVVAPARVEVRASIFRDLRSRSATRAETLAASVGAGGEIAGVREYVHGDPRRQIAWKRSASRGQFIVKQTLDERPTICRVLIDRSVATAGVAEQELALSAGVSSIEEALRRGMSGVLLIDWAGVRIEVPHGANAARRLLDAAARIDLVMQESPAESGISNASIVVCAGRPALPTPGATLIDVRTPENWRNGPALVLPAPAQASWKRRWRPWRSENTQKRTSGGAA